ncbi:nucleotide exchange factor GrpE [Candidatus Dependentiae bacterium]|nr:nucleotide exchange factor GrpE [Candidatus Dependentiae bacterium]
MSKKSKKPPTIEDLEKSLDKKRNQIKELKKEYNSLQEELNIASEKIKNFDEIQKKKSEEFLRIHADFENVKNRLNKAKNQSIQIAIEDFMRKLLPFLDHLELAIKNSKDIKDPKEIIHGINLIHIEFLKILSDEGLKNMESLNSKFDPNYHEAVQMTDGKESGIISEVLLKGYLFKEKLLRPAKVKVVK